MKAELAGRDVFQQQDLAAMRGVKPDNWSHYYADYCEFCAASSRGSMRIPALYGENPITTNDVFFAAGYCKSQLNSMHFV
ncbi:TPA: hypothetical protein ACQ431_000843 [Citrobacter murliniae]